MISFNRENTDDLIIILLSIQIFLSILILLTINKHFIKRTLKFCITILKRLIKVFLYYVLKIFPRTKKLIVFGSNMGMDISGNPKFLYEELKKIGEWQCVWVLKSKQAVKKANKAGYECYYVHSLKGIYLQLRAFLVIHSHSIHDDFNSLLLGGAVSINTWHGVGLKKVWGANKKTFTYKTIHEKNKIKKWFNMFVVRLNFARENYVISTSERVSSYYPETFLVNKENILMLGQARNDIFFKEVPEEKHLPEYLLINKTITYMPTHRNYGKLDQNIKEVLDLEKLNELCGQYGYKFLIKRHLYSVMNNPEQIRDYPHIIDINKEHIDPQLLLKHTDILITDYSSCYTDFLLLDRPIIFYCYDLDFYLDKSNEMYFDYHEVTPGPKVQSFADLILALENTMQEPSFDPFKEERKRVLNIFYAKENQQPVTEKQVNFIINKILHR